MPAPRPSGRRQGVGRASTGGDNFPPTAEQAELVAATAAGASVVGVAFAGAGKTATARLVVARAQSRGRRALYVTFNRAMAREARRKLPCEASTFHGLAWRALRPPLRRVPERIPTSLFATFLRLEPVTVTLARREIVLTPNDLASAVRWTLDRFCQSADPEITPRHAPNILRLLDIRDWTSVDAAAIDNSDDAVALTELFVAGARAIFAEMQRTLSDFPLTQDAVAKMWSLRDPRIDADLIVFDEAQDAAPCFIDVIERQGAQVVWIGDPCQQIYEWRGARNALASVAVDRMCYLTESFRFGPHIAEVATQILKHLGETKPVIGRGGKPQGGPRAILCRTNATALTQYLALLEKGVVATLEVGSDLPALLHAIASLRAGKPVGPLRLFRSYDELIAFAERPEGGDLKAVITAVETLGCEALIRQIEKAKEVTPDVIVTTCHRAKGREFDHVTIAPWGRKIEGDAELRLAYVAVTRARCHVDLCDEISRLSANAADAS